MHYNTFKGKFLLILKYGGKLRIFYKEQENRFHFFTAPQKTLAMKEIKIRFKWTLPKVLESKWEPDNSLLDPDPNKKCDFVCWLYNVQSEIKKVLTATYVF